MRAIVLIGITLLFISCEKELPSQDYSSVTFNIGTGAPQSSGGVFVYGKSDPNGNGQTFSFGGNVVGPDMQLVVPNGTWRFSAVAWDGASALEGTARCFVSPPVPLTGGELFFDVKLATTNCDDDYFAPVNFRAGKSLFPLRVGSCSTLPGANVATCPGNAIGLGRSFRLALPEYFSLESGFNFSIAGGIGSNCYDFDTTNGYTDTDIRVPAGFNGPESPFFTIVEFYDGAGCTGDVRVFSFDHGLFGSPQPESVVSSLAGTTNHVGLFMEWDSSPPAINWTVNSLASTTAFGTTGNNVYTLTNNSTISITGLTISLTTGTYTTLSHNCPSSFPPGSTCQATVSFNTPGAGSFAETLEASTTHLGANYSVSESMTFNGTFSNISIAPTYSSYANWNSYLLNDGANFYSATGTACDATADSPSNYCLHGGDKRTISLTGVATCNNITAVDSLNVFKWTCVMISSTPTILSTGLREGKGLKDLISTAGIWLSPEVSIFQSGFEIYRVQATTWWTNTINLLADATADGLIHQLDATGSIYVVSSDIATSGVKLMADSVGLVTLNNYQIAKNETFNTPNCDLDHDSSNDAFCIVFTKEGIRFNWIEGKFYSSNTNAPSTNVFFDRLYSSRIHKTNATGTLLAGTCMKLYETRNLQISNLKLNKCGTYGINLEKAQKTHLQGAVISNTNGDGIYLNYDATGNVFTQVVSVSNQSSGIYTGGDKNTFSHLTLYNNIGHGLNAEGLNSTYNNVLAMNANNAPIHFGSGAFGSLLHNAISAQPSGGNLIEDTSGVTYSGNFGFTSTPVCSSSGEFSASCSYTGSTIPAPNISFGLNVNTALHYRVLTEDSVNEADTNGQVTASALTSAARWGEFDNVYRAWGLTGTNAGTSVTGMCVSGPCEIWDYSIQAGDVTISNNTLNILSTNSAFSTAACPDAVAGTNATSDAIGNTFLFNAIEEIDDAVGDDDGLCESSERCRYAPHFGAYQGHGSTYQFIGCAFTDGNVTQAQIVQRPHLQR